MPKRTWSFFTPAEDHPQIKWFQAFLRSRFTPWGQIIVAVLLPSLVIASGRPQLSAYLFPSFILALLLTSFLLSLYFKPKISAIRILPPPPNAGGKYVYNVVIKNIGHHPIRNLAVFEDCLPYGLYADVNHSLFNNTVDWLDPGQEATLSLALKTPIRGVFEFPKLVAGSAFPSGITRVTVRAGDYERMTVYPRLIDPIDLPDHFQQVLQSDGIPGSSKTGDSNEFVSTREYREGDRMRDIHWASSARAGKLIIKEYVEESFVRVGLFLDTSPDSFNNRNALESRISLCAGTAQYLNDNNHLYDLYVDEQRKTHWQAGPGVDSFHRFLQRLALIEGDRKVNFDRAVSSVLQDARCLSHLMLFLKDWDEPRSRFVDRLIKSGLKLSAIIVSGKPTTLRIPDRFVSVYSPQDLKGKRRPSPSLTGLPKELWGSKS